VYILGKLQGSTFKYLNAFKNNRYLAAWGKCDIAQIQDMSSIDK
jgi:hypothetical protein